MTMEFGRKLRLRLYGSSHGPEVGVTVDGLPPGTAVDLAAIQVDLDRRRPVGRRLATRRQEEDHLLVDRGVVEGRSDGSTFQAHVANTDVRREPYDLLRDTPRPGHADYPARVRYGPDADLSGGGIFSGRMTAGLVIAGALAKGLLASKGIEVVAFTRSVGAVDAEVADGTALSELARRSRSNEVGSPDPAAAERMEQVISEARRAGDSVGGIVEVLAEGVPVGLGEPFFDSLESVLAHAYFSVPAVKGVEFGAGFRAARMRGSEHNDPFVLRDGVVRTTTNHAGGILGGLATGMPIVARVAVKPASSIAQRQETVNLRTGEPARIVVTGRHDPCIVPRAVVVLEAVTAFTLADLGLEGGFLP
jgi:chorismate synthase